MSRGCGLPAHSPLPVAAQSLQGTKRPVVADISKRPRDETLGFAVLFPFFAQRFDQRRHCVALPSAPSLAAASERTSGSGSNTLPVAPLFHNSLVAAHLSFQKAGMTGEQLIHCM